MDLLQLQVEKWEEVGNEKNMTLLIEGIQQHAAEMIANLKPRYDKNTKKPRMFTLN